MRKTEKNGGFYKKAAFKKRLNLVNETKQERIEAIKMEKMEKLKEENNGELRDKIIEINAKMVKKIYNIIKEKKINDMLFRIKDSICVLNCESINPIVNNLRIVLPIIDNIYYIEFKNFDYNFDNFDKDFDKDFEDFLEIPEIEQMRTQIKKMSTIFNKEYLTHSQIEQMRKNDYDILFQQTKSDLIEIIKEKRKELNCEELNCSSPLPPTPFQGQIQGGKNKTKKHKKNKTQKRKHSKRKSQKNKK